MQEQIIPVAIRFGQAAHGKNQEEYDNIFLETSVKSIELLTEGLKVTFEGKVAPKPMYSIRCWSL